MKLRNGLVVLGALALVSWLAVPQQSGARVAHEFLMVPAHASAEAQLPTVQPVQLAVLFQNVGH